MMKPLVFVLAALSCAGFSCTNREVLHQNVQAQNLAELRENVEEGIDINGKDGYGYTPLILAAYYGYGPMVKYLCEKGADVDAQNDEGWSALLYAVYYGYNDVFNILMDHGADVNLVNNAGYNALWYAERYSRQEMYRMLEKAGAKRLLE